MRKVEYHLERIPNNRELTTEDKNSELVNEGSKSRYGFFHEWGTNLTKYDPLVAYTIGIVEEKGTGIIHLVEPEFIRFLDEPTL